MTVMLGMNDGGYIAFDEARFNRYSAGMEHILQVVKDGLPEHQGDSAGAFAL